MISRFPIQYRVYGLVVESDREIPELLAVPEDAHAPADVVVRTRRVLRSEQDPTSHWLFVRADGTAIFHVEGVASFAIRDGASIDVDPAPAADVAAISVYLLGTALGIIQHQRGLLPLHVGAVEVDGVAVAYTAPSGTGKSTLTAELSLLAHLPVVADDVATFVPQGTPPSAGHPMDGPYIWPGPPAMKLLPDTIDALGLPSLELVPEFRASPKQRVRSPVSITHQPLPLFALIVLERANNWVDGGVALTRQRGSQAFLLAQAAVYRLEMAPLLMPSSDLVRRIGQLAASVPIFRGELSPPDRHAPRKRSEAVVRTLRTVIQSLREQKKPVRPYRYERQEP